jgi:microcystin-dependent protein
MADGATDEIRKLYLKITSSATLSATRTLTLAPNTVSKVWIIENSTTGSQSINISQGSGANVTIPNGAVKVIATDGAGSGAAVYDLSLVDLSGTQTLTNKSIDSDNNTITNIVNADIKSSAAIAFSKMADLTVSRALVSDSSGDVSVSAVTSTEIGYLDGVSSAIQTQIDTKTTLAAALAAVYPVGSIYINATSSTNPATLLGFGTWSAFGAGRVMVGIDSSDSDFDGAQETGGAKTVTLSTSNLPSHTHTFSGTTGSTTPSMTATDSGHSHGITLKGNVPAVTTSPASSSASDTTTGTTATAQANVTISGGAHTHTFSGTTGSTGSGSAVSIVQPYITVYMWRRTA